MREGPPRLQRRVNDQAISLAREWRMLGRVATLVALLTSPALFVVLHFTYEWSVPWAIVLTFAGVVIFRGAVDVLAHKLIPAPALYGAEDALKEQDVMSRRRVWYWRHKFKVWWYLAVITLLVLGVVAVVNGVGLIEAWSIFWDGLPKFFPMLLQYAMLGVSLLLINLLVILGPLLFLGIQQIKAYEPGDADWGVKLEDVRGQAEAKTEITRVVSLWQSGEEFEKAGGKRERGVLFLGAPGTGKTMLSKAIATSFNCPFVTIPGSGFASTFIGMDAVLVRFLARKAKKLAGKWGGQCIVFIDEIDAVGMRRRSLGSGFQPLAQGTIHDAHFYGRDGALTTTGDLVLETAAWREKLFAMREEHRPSPYPALVVKAADAVRNFMIPGGMGGGGLALNQLLVVMDGIDDPPLMKRFRTRRFNTFLDALYIVPPRIGRLRLRMKPPRPRKEEVYFIGACNAPLEHLDPALTRPGRMGRHIYFRTPTWEDRRDIFDLYLGKVAHEADLDSEDARDELARITNGYSPAMIDQVCSLALTYAHSDDRGEFNRADLLGAMTTVESGVAIGQPYPPHEERSIAIHEAGHAVCGHIYMENRLSTRLSIRKRGSSGGHHQAMEIEDRFVSWRSEQVGDVIWGLGAMAAEHVFYDQTTTGVGGDVGMVTWRAAQMVGRHAMGPTPIDLSDRIADPEQREKAEEKVMARFEKLGTQLMQRADVDLPATTDVGKRKLVAGLLGQAFVVAWCTVRANKDATDYIATRLIAAGEMYGNDVTDLLDECRLVKPEIDVLDEATWPVI